MGYFERALRCAAIPESQTLNQNLLAAYHRWGFQLLRERAFPEAIACLNRGLAHFPFSEILLYDIGVAYDSVGEHQRALLQYQRAIQIAPEYPPPRIGMAAALNNLGAQHAGRRDWKQAIDCYQQALACDPGCEQAHQNLQATLMRIAWEKGEADDLEGAISTYQEVLTLSPKDAQVHNNLGVMYFKKQDYENSTAHFEKALALDENHIEAQRNLDYIKRQHTTKLAKRALGPLALVLVVAFLTMYLTARQANRLQRK